MPRLRPRLLRSSFYLFRVNPETGKKEGPRGSGLVIERPAEKAGLRPHVYAVTAYHVAVSDGSSIIRLNTWKGAPPKLGHREIDLDPEKWSFIPSGHDIAVADITDEFRPDEGDWIRSVRDVDFVTPSFIKQVKLGLGDDGFMLGLFTPNPGKDYNLPATRFGNIAQLADSGNPIQQGHGYSHPSHVFDIHSRPGFSGSPVFVYRTPANALTGIEPDGEWTLDSENNVFLALLGIHSGQFKEEAEVALAEAYGAPPIHAGDKLLIPSSMTIVVPAWAIDEVLGKAELEERRKERERRSALQSVHRTD